MRNIGVGWLIAIPVIIGGLIGAISYAQLSHDNTAVIRTCIESTGGYLDPRSGDGPECEQYGPQEVNESAFRAALRGIPNGVIGGFIVGIALVFVNGFIADRRKSPKSTFLFHLSDDLRKSFDSKTAKRPTFYWFNDSYHSHVMGDEPAYKYMYLFVVKPHPENKLFTRHDGGDFRAMWSDYLDYLKQRRDDHMSSKKKYIEPGIVMSFSHLVPDVVGELDSNFNFKVLKPAEYKGVSFNLKEGPIYRHFDQIPELRKIIPSIKYATPFVKPTIQEINNPAEFFYPDFVNTGKHWL